MIVVHHFNTTCRNFHINLPNCIKNIIAHSATSFGCVGVALFFILSGAVLTLSSKKEFDIFNHYEKRLTRIWFPQWIGFICAYLLLYARNGKLLNTDIFGHIISFLGLNYASESWQSIGIKVFWIIGEWFTAVIILLYIIFPLLKYLFKKQRLISSIVIILIFALNLKYEILSYKNGWFSITNGLMCFWVGMFFEEYKEFLTNRKMMILTSISALVLYILNPAKILGYPYLTCFFFSILLFMSLHNIKFSNKFTQYICKYNYEIYLTHHRIYLIFMPALLKPNCNGLQILLTFLFLTGIVFLASEQLEKISKFCITLYFKHFKDAKTSVCRM